MIRKAAQLRLLDIVGGGSLARRQLQGQQEVGQGLGQLAGALVSGMPAPEQGGQAWVRVQGRRQQNADARHSQVKLQAQRRWRLRAGSEQEQ